MSLACGSPAAGGLESARSPRGPRVAAAEPPPGGVRSRQGRASFSAAARLLPVLLVVLCLSSPVLAAPTTRVSVSSDGMEGNDASGGPAISLDARYVAFASDASNLVPADTNATMDVFVHDLVTGQTERVSVASDGAQGNGPSFSPAISGDGRYVAFNSFASDLVADDSNGCADVFVHDRDTGQTERVSVASEGTEGDGASYWPATTADGRYVAFFSYASDLVEGDANEAGDVFVHDRQTGQTERASVANDGTEGDNESNAPAISADGRYVAFPSCASNLVAGDTNDQPDVFMHDRETGQTERVSLASDGSEADACSWWAAISADGRYVAFPSCASNLVAGDTNGYPDIFVRDRQTGQTERVSVSSEGNEGGSCSNLPSISADGRYVAFVSYAPDLVAGAASGIGSIFVHDRTTHRTELASVAGDGTEGNGEGDGSAISAEGRYVAFQSFASNLVAPDTNDTWDVFLRERAVCGFSGNPTRGHAGVMVDFTDLSAGEPTGWEWDFGDGDASTAQDLSHEYSAAGSYTVALTVTDGASSDSETKERYIKVSFSDVPISPPDPADYWALDQILACVEAGVVSGYPNGTYRPGDDLDRGQMAVYISRGLVAPSGDAAIPTGPAVATFSGVPTDHWAFQWVEFAVAQNIVAGYPDGTYRPDEPVDRGQMAVYIARAMAAPSGDAGVPDGPPDPTFPDVSPTGDWAWCYQHVESIAGAGVAQGYDDGTYRPAVIVKRDQMAVYVQRAFGLAM